MEDITLRIALMVLRSAVLINLVLGILFWINTIDPDANPAVKWLHIILGIAAVISLFTIGILQGVRGGSFGLALATFVVGFLLTFVGLFQTNWLTASNQHWIIQIIHLLLGLSAIGLGEMIVGRYNRMMAAKAKAA
jgi:hypothetical protein